ncbi:MAG TPA: hypothetical protein VN033_03405 [Vulgatibacter sp.]|nr:hypothetical protein [Vulgatibacter sp.]
MGALDLRQLAEAGAAWPGWIAASILAVGLVLAGFGSRGALRRGTMALAAGTVGWLLFARIPAWLPGIDGHWSGALALGIAGFLFPRFGGAAAGALIGGAIGAALSPEKPIAQLTGVVVFSIAAAVAARRIAAVASALIGALMSTVAAIALLPDGLRATLAPYPAAPLLPMVVIACVGAAYQIGGRSWKKKPAKERHEPYADDVAARRAA